MPQIALISRLWAWLNGAPAPRAGVDAELGRRGEAHARRLLTGMGFRVLASNVRVRRGEADLVCEAPDRRTLVIVEVKARRRRPGETKRVAPEASITARKRRKLLFVARKLARLNGWTHRPVRIDAVAVEWPEEGDSPRVTHYAGAVKA